MAVAEMKAMGNYFKNDSQKTKAVFALIAVAIILDVSFLMQAQLQALKKLDPKIAKIKQDILRLNTESAAAKAESVQKFSLRQELAAKTKRVVHEAEIVGLLQSISDYAKKNNVQILQVNPRTESAPKEGGEEKYATFMISLEMTGDYHRLGAFLSDLERMPFFLSVDELRIFGQANEVARQKISLVLKAYVSTSFKK